MRKVLVPALCASAATVPAVALAATNDEQTYPSQPNPGVELRQEATQRLNSSLQHARHVRRAKLRTEAHRRARAASARSSASPQLEAIAACESGGNPSAIGGGGAFRGKYQFDYGTWASVGGSGDPAAAPEAEQDMRAAMLLQRSGTSPWPVCG